MIEEGQIVEVEGQKYFVLSCDGNVISRSMCGRIVHLSPPTEVVLRKVKDGQT